MTQAVQDEMRDLITEIEYHRRRYYLDQDPEISDFEYDQLERRLKELEQAHPELRQSDSPTQRVGGFIADSHPSQPHRTPMLSLDNAYTEEEVLDFVKKCQEATSSDLNFSAELKIDGLSISLRYRFGSLAAAVTRGDGTVGEEVTSNAKTIRCLPLFVKEWRDLEEVEIRGEVYFRRSRFEVLNQERMDKGLDAFANPRNAASGSLRLLDSTETATRGLDMFIYQAVGTYADRFESHYQLLTHLKSLGFPTNEHTTFCPDAEQLIQTIQNWQDLRHDLDYDTDGMVLKVDELRAHEEIGFTQKFPKWALAFKFQAEQATTQIKAITIQVGRTGVLTPVAELEPVLLAGTTVSRATLHNFEEIQRKDIRVGDWVFIEKGGEIIPKVVKVILNKRNDPSCATEPPTQCPTCGGSVEQEKGQVAIRCVNLSCPAQLERRIQHFAQRKAMDIRGLGKEWVQTLTRAGLLTDLPSIYQLKASDLKKLERTGEKWIENLLNEIEASKTRPFRKLLFGVGIPMIGEKAAELLVDHFLSFERLSQASEEELAALHGVGEQMAWSIAKHLKEDTVQRMFNTFAELGLQLSEKPSSSDQQRPLENKTVVITGTLDAMSRTQAADLLKQLGAKVTSSVSKQTDFLLAGAKAGSKLAKAKKLEVEIVDEEWLQQWQKV